MGKKKHHHDQAPHPQRSDAPAPARPAPADVDDIEGEMDAELVRYIGDHPEMAGDALQEIAAWRTSFSAENGREPTEADFEAWIGEVLASDEEEDEQLSQCGWCGKPLPEDAHMLTVGVAPADEVDPDDLPITFARELPLSHRRIILVLSDEEAEEGGYDIGVVVCCQACQEAAQAELPAEMEELERRGGL